MGDTRTLLSGDFDGIEFGNDLPKRFCSRVRLRFLDSQTCLGDWGTRLGTSEAPPHSVFHGETFALRFLLQSGLFLGLHFDFQYCHGFMMPQTPGKREAG